MEFSIYDRSIQGSCNFGQYEVIHTEAARDSKCTPTNALGAGFSEEMQDHGLVIMMGVLAGAEPPMNPETIQAC